MEDLVSCTLALITFPWRFHVTHKSVPVSLWLADPGPSGFNRIPCCSHFLPVSTSVTLLLYTINDLATLSEKLMITFLCG
jgi:hypothetical protein